MIAATPASSKRRPSSSAVSVEVCGPALDRHQAVLGVDADRDLAGMEPRRLAHESRVAHRRRADDDARNALGEPALDSLHVANAAAELHRNADALEDGVDGRGVHRLSGECAVEIDHVQPFEALALERCRLSGRIVVEDVA